MAVINFVLLFLLFCKLFLFIINHTPFISNLQYKYNIKFLIGQAKINYS